MAKKGSYIDLSLPLSNKTPVYPGDPLVVIDQFLRIEKDGCSIHNYRFSGHVSTHIDSQSHFVQGGKNLTDYPVDKFIGEGVVIDARNVSIIDMDCIRRVSIKKNSIVLFWTGYNGNINQDSYFEDYPILGKTLAQRLVSLGVKMVGIDGPGVDHDPFPIHKILLGGDVLILENLCNLDLLYKKKLEVMAFPIAVETDGVPVRVVAKLIEE